MTDTASRRAFLQAAGGAALGLVLGRRVHGAVVDAALPVLPLSGSVAVPAPTWRAIAQEATDAACEAHESWLYYAVQAGGLDDPHDERRFLPIKDPFSSPYVPPTPYELARVVERQRWFRAERRGNARWSAVPCVPSEVASLTTREIRARLAAAPLKIDGSPGAFLALVRETVSPWSAWRRYTASLLLPAPEEDFAMLAAWELWRRTSPKPHDEAIDDWAHGVLPECDRGDPLGACELGLRAWGQLSMRWGDDTSTANDADQTWAGSVPMANFLPSLANRLVAITASLPRFLPIAHTVIEDTLARFRGDAGLREELVPLRAALV